jgi:glycerol-3-phosphate cytidylyltransferase
MKLIGGKPARVGFTCSAFDLCHAGHISMLEEAKSQCEWLIVGLQNDPTADRPSKNRPVQSIVERFIQISALKFVDEVIPYNTEKDLEDLLLMLPIDVRILGDEYKDKNFTGKDICVRRGIDLYFNRREHSFSTTDLRRRVATAEYKQSPIPFSSSEPSIPIGDPQKR